MQPKKYIVDGKEKELYSISVMAEKIERQRQTVRLWEKRQVIPPAKYRTSSGARLYSKEQINVLSRLVNKYDLKQGKKIPEEFREEVFSSFKNVD